MGYNDSKYYISDIKQNVLLINKGMMGLNLDKEIIDDIIKICEKHEYIEKVILFGSRARGDNNIKSDIDLAIYSNEQ